MEYQNILAIDDPYTPGGMCYYLYSSESLPGIRIAVVHIPKCGTMSLKTSFKNKGILDKLRYDPEFKYAAIVRHPLGRWVSGIATNIANRIQNKIITYEQALKALNDAEFRNHLFNQVTFEVHTKPQYLFIEPVKDCVKLFSATNRQPFYNWLNKHGISAQDEKLHHVVDFSHTEYHYQIYKHLQQMVMDDVFKQKRILEYYRKDLELYERANSN